MATASRTVNPLHFEDLEPHRFEDLVRQLAYDFKPWRKLEATGRSGSDDGFDARGLEIVFPEGEEPSGEGEDAEAQPGTEDRLWLIQCKREKAIGPKKLLEYLNDIPEEEQKRIYGVILAAPCEFSKKSRDAFHVRCSELGFSESHLWGRGDLEDMIFQPKNDHLLFAYFGFSLTIRRRTIRTELRAKLAMKRKAHRMLGDKRYAHILVIDPEETSYPHVKDEPGFNATRRWRVYRFSDFDYAGLKFEFKVFHAYLGLDAKSWDAALALNLVFGGVLDPWDRKDQAWEELKQKVEKEWEALPEDEQATLEVSGYIPYERILDIDEHGDDWKEGPHVYTSFIDGSPFHLTSARIRARKSERDRHLHSEEFEDRIERFSLPLRELSGNG